MNVDVDLLRDILRSVRGDGRAFTVTGYPEKDVQEVADELRRKGYILANTLWIPGEPYPFVMPRRLTEQGEKLARAVESELVWRQVKQWLPRPEDRVSLIVTQRVAEKVIRMMN